MHAEHSSTNQDRPHRKVVCCIQVRAGESVLLKFDLFLILIYLQYIKVNTHTYTLHTYLTLHLIISI